MPVAVTPLRTFQPAVAMWLYALLARLAQIGRVERGDVNIRTGRLPQPRRPSAAQTGHMSFQILTIAAFNMHAA